MKAVLLVLELVLRQYLDCALQDAGICVKYQHAPLKSFTQNHTGSVEEEGVLWSVDPIIPLFDPLGQIQLAYTLKKTV